MFRGLISSRVVIAVLVLACAGSIALDAGGGGTENDALNESEIEQLTLQYVNEKRQANGMDPLSVNPQAREAARDHAEDMAEKDYFNHTSLDGQTQEERYAFCGGGENIYQSWVDQRVQGPKGDTLVVTTEDESAQLTVEGWMNSDPHRERGIYGEWWNSAGVGVSISEDGKLFVVMGFCSR